MRESGLGEGSGRAGSEGNGYTRRAAITPQCGRCYDGVGLQVTSPTEILEVQKGFPEVWDFKRRPKGEWKPATQW